VQRHAELQKGIVDIDGTILSNQAPKEPGEITQKKNRRNVMGGGERKKKKIYLAYANEYLAFLDVGSTLVETRQEPSS
jgi:hypothetical protein